MVISHYHAINQDGFTWPSILGNDALGGIIKILCIKFRTMRVNKFSDSIQATLGDSRVTKMAFMRRTNIDELPQFSMCFGYHVCDRASSAHAEAYRTIFRIDHNYLVSLCQTRNFWLGTGKRFSGARLKN
jgi:hypothetical protein